jgi:tRNA U34 5-methylaminomethyl-2-thiouridine-forming methyltransferase MnmC
MNLWSAFPTGDGSFTFYSPTFQATFHSISGAWQEAEEKYVRPSGLLKASSPIKVLDICYGLGYNSAALLNTLWQERPEAKVQLIALELELEVPRAAHQLGGLSHWPLAEAALGVLASDGTVETDCLSAQLLIGDARKTIVQVPSHWADGIFLDPFSPECCPMLWSVEFLALVAQRLQRTGSIVTYAASASVRTALKLAGLSVGSTPPVGRRTPGTIANWQGGLPPLSQQESEHLQTTAAIPFRDLTLEDDTETLHIRRTDEQRQSGLEPSSHWRKRWSLGALTDKASG